MSTGIYLRAEKATTLEEIRQVLLDFINESESEFKEIKNIVDIYDIKSLQEDINKVQSDVDNISDDIKSVESDVDDLRDEVNKLQVNQ